MVQSRRYILYVAAAIIIGGLVAGFVMRPASPALPPERRYSDLAPQFSERLHELRQQAEKHPRDPERIRALAEFYTANGKTSEARACFALLQRSSAGLSARDHYFLADLAQGENDLVRATVELSGTLNLQPDYIPARLARANALMKSGNTEAAKDDYSRVLSGEPNQPEATMAVVKIKLQNGKTDEAVRDLEDLLAAHPAATTGAALLATLAERRGEIDRAAALRQMSLERPEPPLEDPWKVSLIGECFSVQKLSLVFEEAFRDGRVGLAEKALTRLTVLAPKDPAVLFFVGVSQAAGKRFDEAIAAFEAALSAGGEAEKICPQLVSALVARGRVEEAESVGRAWQRKFPESLPIAKAYAAVAMRHEDPALRSVLEFILQREPLLKAENMALAKILWESGDKDRAAECLRRVAQVASDDIPSRALLGEYYLGRAEPSAAILPLEQALSQSHIAPEARNSLQNSLADAYASCADASARAGDITTAIATLRKLAGLQPKNPTVLLTLGDLLAQDGQLSQAKTQWQLAEKWAPTGDSTLRNEIWQRLGRR